ncbi:cobalamin ABC transporter substrate-binding protein [Sphingomonas glacialis]|uniref:Cobalamin ABC transporter substrate-binding protein n=1 Tax=Sphingomonas glacialis TaxID=658225 RepID=A0ABQ3LEU2_9SPHN|nr:ABC transporter substrate-binding protein [Sphingomonas glacialis]GHH13282.1 cobalamin ABC transporter substrate-binding protein [Sphingomonas glacialis]
MRSSRIVLALTSFVLLGAARPAPVPRRIVSLNLCADQLLVGLADRGQIVALTEWARDPELSAIARQARDLPFTHRSAEEVMALRPDLVIGAPFQTRAVLAPLKAQGLTLLELPRGEGVAAIEASITTLAAAVGHPERGTRMIARMRRALAAVGPPPGRRRVAAYYQRQGYLTGTGTLVDEMFRRVGLVNLARRLGRPALSQLSLEEMALARPDFLILETGTRAVADRGTAALHHPLLDTAVPAARHLYIEQAQTVCGSPAFADAVASLAAQVRAVDRAAARRR